MKRTRITRVARILKIPRMFKHRDMELQRYTEITKHRDMEVRGYTEMKREKEEKEERREKELALRAPIKAKPLCFSRLLHTFKPRVSVFKKIKSEASVFLSSSSLKFKPCVSVFSVIFLSCVGVTLSYPGMVEIAPAGALPAMEYRFYAPDTCLVRADDGAGAFRGRLPADTYRVLAVNADGGAANVDFGGLDGYETATVSARGVEPPTPGFPYALVDTVGPAFAVRLGKLEVAENGAVGEHPLPELLARRLVLVFTFADGLETEVVSLTGVLPGVFPAVLLSTGRPPEPAPGTVTAVRFGISGEGAQRTAQVGLLGLYDPGGQQVQDAGLLALTLTLNDGERKAAVVNDLPALLSAIIAGNGGVFPSPLYMTIGLAPASDGDGNVTITAGIKEWQLNDGLTLIVN